MTDRFVTKPTSLPDCVCTIKTLPEHERIAAAAQAIEINPANAPARHLMQSAPADFLTPDRLSFLVDKRWGPDGVRLSVSFLDDAPPDLRAKILSHMNAWGSFANVQFNEVATGGKVRISRVAGSGYWSYLGTDILRIPANEATMNLDSFSMATADAEFYRVVRHETGHTLGFPHEHTRDEIVSRIDVDKAITYFTQTQGWTPEQVRQQVLTPLNNSALIGTAHADPASIMCYWLPGRIMKDGKDVIGGRDIDVQDAQFAETVYPKPAFSPLYAQGDPGNGIGGYDLKSPADRAFAFDYDQSGKLDHVALYRPATGTFWILKHSAGIFSPVYAQGAPGAGIGGYDLKSPADRCFAFDFNHTGRLDHIALYRPGTGTLWILKNEAGNFSPVFQQGDPGSGIGGYDLKSSADRIFAFDFDHSGKMDHLALYRPATGTFWILKHAGGTFTPVYHQGDPGTGIGGYDMKSAADEAFAFDYDHSGRQDHIALYRPGTGTFWILKNAGGTFSPVFAQGDPGNGIGGYDLKARSDRAFAYDFEGSGKQDHIALYRPGTGTFWVLKNVGGSFRPVYQQGDPGAGVGGYDLKSTADKVFAMDFQHSGKTNSLALYRPGTGTFWILKRN